MASSGLWSDERTGDDVERGRLESVDDCLCLGAGLQFDLLGQGVANQLEGVGFFRAWSSETDGPIREPSNGRTERYRAFLDHLRGGIDIRHRPQHFAMLSFIDQHETKGDDVCGDVGELDSGRDRCADAGMTLIDSFPGHPRGCHRESSLLFGGGRRGGDGDGLRLVSRRSAHRATITRTSGDHEGQQ